jgi:hypothetical protein
MGVMVKEFEQAGERGAAASARSAVGDDLNALKGDLAKLTATVAGLAKTVGVEIAGVAGAGAETAKDQVRSLTAEAEKMIRRHPLGAATGVFILGLLIGLMRSR